MSFLPRPISLAALLATVVSFFCLPSFAQIRDGGIDPWNLGKGDWIYYMSMATNKLGGNVSSVTNEASLMKFYKSQGIRYIIIKAATSNELFYGSYSFPQFTSNVVNKAHAEGIWVFGYNRTFGGDIPGEIAISDYVFNQGADGFVWDGESEWESSQPWIGTNGPAKAWQLCSTVRSNWPTKFLAHSPFPIISIHSSFPYKEFGYWCDAVMPQIYPQNWTGVFSRPSGGINWTDANWNNWQKSLVGASSVINGQTIYWTNSIKPLVPANHVYGPNPPNSGVGQIPDEYVMEFVDYLTADPNAVTVGGYKGANFWRADLHGAGQWSNIQPSTIGSLTNVVNNIVIDDPTASRTAGWTPVKVFYNGSYFGATGADKNPFGTNYLVKGQGTGVSYVQFTPSVLTAGDYNVYQWHVLRADASASVPFLIDHAAGSTTVYANQQTNDGKWTLLGRFPFATGTNGTVKVLDNFPEASAVAVADGLKLVFVPPTATPAVPAGLQAVATSSSEINLTWNNNATNETGFIVARSTTNGGPYINVGTVGINATNFNDSGLSQVTTYYYVVRAVNYLGASANSVQASAITFSGLPLPPSIETAPQSQTVVAGFDATFSVIASGSPPFLYQWFFNGTLLSGATNSSFSRIAVQPSDAGNYAVVITNLYGSVTNTNATLTVLTPPPTITSPPQNQTVNVGVTATFSVTASGAAPLRYQWVYNSTDIPGATNSSYAKTNVQPPDGGNYSAIVSNAYGHAISSNAVLTVNVLPPVITSHPQNRAIIAGQGASFTVTATGTSPLAYQWRFNGTNISGATVSSLVLTNVVTNPAGNYSVVVSNYAATVMSADASLVVYPLVRTMGWSKLWSLSPGARSYLTSTAHTERGVAYNPISNRLLLLSRASGTKIFVLNGDTGADLHNMNVDSSIVTGGTYPLLMLGVAEDGVVYAGNLTTDGSTTAFRLYRWVNDDAATVPTLVFSGDPSPGSVQRWGDTFDVRGAGTNTQVLLGSRLGNRAAVLTTSDGTNFVVHPITVSDSSNGGFGLGVSFGLENTFWGKTTNQPLRWVSFDLNNGVGSSIRLHATNNFPASIAPLGVNPALNLLAGIAVDSPDSLKLYDLTLTNGTPVLLGVTNFSVNNTNQFYVGSVDFGNDRVYAMDANDGLLAMQLIPAPTPAGIATQPQSQSIKVGSNAIFSVTASGTAPWNYQWRFNGSNILNATQSAYSLVSVQTNHAGVYSVFVTNVTGSAISSNALLTVLAATPLEFQSIAPMTNGQFHLVFNSDSGTGIWIERSTNLIDWHPVTNFVATNGTVEFIDAFATNHGKAFYRMHQ